MADKGNTKGLFQGPGVYTFMTLLCVCCIGCMSASYFMDVFYTSPVKMWMKPAAMSNSIRAEAKPMDDQPTTSLPEDEGFINTSVSLMSPKKDAIKVGDMLHYIITCRHKDGSLLHSGGGFWYATLDSKANPKASTAGKIEDHNNGTYSIYIYAGWAGKASLSVRRVLSRQAVDFMLNTIWPADDRVVWSGFFNVPGSKNKPSGLCRLTRHGNWTGKCVYANKNALGKTVFLCEKPRGVDCGNLYGTKSNGRKISARVRELARGKEHLFIKPIQLDEPPVNISGAGAVAAPNLPQCLPDVKLPPSQGYWLQDKWQSLLCQITDWTEKAKLTSCLQNRNILLFGDSTTRQWFVHILDLMGRKFVARKGEPGFFWRRYYEDIDMSITISFPKQLVGSATVILDTVHYEHDLIDELNNTRCNYVIMVSPWAHFSQWTRESYTERTEKLREALIRFRRRCPDAKIVLKGPHPRDQKNFDALIYSSDVILWGIGEINQRLLSGIGVWFLPIWDMNLAFPVRKTIHMPVTVIHEEVKMFMSYVCGDSKMPALKV